MNLHDKIMNLPLGGGASEWRTETLLYPYKCGHRDARHAAAELAVKHDALLEQMAAALEVYSHAVESGMVDADLKSAYAVGEATLAAHREASK